MRLALAIVTPAKDNTIISQATGVATTCRYRCESLAFRRRGLASVIATPANCCTVISQATSVMCASAYLREAFISEIDLVLRGRGLTPAIATPADGGSIITQPAGMGGFPAPTLAAAYSYEALISWRLGGSPPAEDETVIAQPTSEFTSTAYGYKAFIVRR